MKRFDGARSIGIVSESLVLEGAGDFVKMRHRVVSEEYFRINARGGEPVVHDSHDLGDHLASTGCIKIILAFRKMAAQVIRDPARERMRRPR
jgi:hypothetical protein